MKFFAACLTVFLSATAVVADCNIASCTQLSCEAYCKNLGGGTGQYACSWSADKGCSDCVCGITGLPPPVGESPSLPTGGSSPFGGGSPIGGGSVLRE